MKQLTRVIALLALALPTFAQQKPFQEQIDVNAVLLDVIVTDSKGNQILGLGKDDFIVKEDGVAQPVESVDYFTNRRLLDQREEDAPFKVERVREDRYFIFFFDKPQNPSFLFDELNRARQAAINFVKEEMQPTDYVAIAGHDVRLKIYTDFTNDKKQLEKGLQEAMRFGKGVTTASKSEGPSILRNLSTSAMINDTGSVYEGLQLLAESLKPIRARKSVVLFSPGIVDRRESVRNNMVVNRTPIFDDALEALNAANVAVYTVQLQDDPQLTPAIHERLSELASATGGRYFQFNTSFEPAVERIEKANSGYYLVTYSSKKPKGEKGYQKVDVKLRNPEFKIVARGGYQYGS
ncbi:MAG TPA: VWA domain-containing protein [Thermoanaerobaculia bacterium]